MVPLDLWMSWNACFVFSALITAVPESLSLGSCQMYKSSVVSDIICNTQSNTPTKFSTYAKTQTNLAEPGYYTYILDVFTDDHRQISDWFPANNSGCFVCRSNVEK